MLVIREKEKEGKCGQVLSTLQYFRILSADIYYCLNLLQHSDYSCISYFNFKVSVFCL